MKGGWEGKTDKEGRKDRKNNLTTEQVQWGKREGPAEGSHLACCHLQTRDSWWVGRWGRKRVGKLPLLAGDRLLLGSMRVW